ncbi:Lipin/Ned1/Smp2-domain-containing protein [Fennellomyces sp. T-0311]|nr:Lipin/Ned1/Smp2-domain-containing protein [Fennellomyces sp. T-0311]
MMKMGEAGEAFFVFETEHEVPEEFQTSPIMSAIEEETKEDEEPPYLDIGESKNPQKDQQKSTEDPFDDEAEKKHTIRVPAELQSPKMIIEEQVDKVVTKMDPFMQPSDEPQPKNDIYPMEDGASLLERYIPEAITSTTVAKETYIVRPADGDIYSTWMDVTHTSVHTRNTPTEPTSPRQNDAESIFLDIAGYKTENDDKDRSMSTPATPTTELERGLGSLSVETEMKKEEPKTEDPEDGINIKPGETYRIELSLCGLAALSADDEKNAEIFDKEQITYDNFVHNPNLLNDRRLVFRHHGRYYTSSHTGPLFTCLVLFRKEQAEETQQEDPVSDSRDTYSFGRGWRQWLSRSSVAAPLPGMPATPLVGPTEEADPNETTTFTTTTKTTSVGWSAQHTHPDEEPLDFPQKNYAKTLRLTSEQLKSLNLQKGVNEVCFSVTSAYQGKAMCKAKIFFWDYDVNIVISDIDGTITKSDALGHMFNFIGRDWTHAGIAKLYTDVEKNGYQFLYLTSRAIGQADSTRDYLKKVQQNEYHLPVGPVIMSPDRLFTSLHREVIMRKPELFKMACLRDVLRLFNGKNPFYAGFGNRITDAISYRSVDVPASRIFTIDPYGELKLELLLGFKSSYLHLNDLVDQIFPPINKAIHEEFSDYNFWKAPLPEIELPEEETPAPTSPKPKPIVSDPSALPPQSVVAAPQRRQRGILRSFTSRSSTTTTYSSSVSSQSSFKISTSASTPTLSSQQQPIPVPPVSASSVAGSPPTEPSSPLTSVASSDDPTTPVESGGIVNKMLGGVFSRTFASKSTTSVVSAEYYEEADDEAFDSTLDAIADEIDMDNIPFI